MAADHPRPVALTITAEPCGFYQGWNMYLSGEPIGHHPYDGSGPDEACDKVTRALAELLREKLGWDPKDPDDYEDEDDEQSQS